MDIRGGVALVRFPHKGDQCVSLASQSSAENDTDNQPHDRDGGSGYSSSNNRAQTPDKEGIRPAGSKTP